MTLKKTFRLCLILFLGLLVMILMQIVPSRSQVADVPAQDTQTQQPMDPRETREIVRYEPVLPEVHFSTDGVAQGDFFAIYIDKTTLLDEVYATSNLTKNRIRFYSFKEGMAAFIPVSYNLKPDIYSISLRIFRDDLLLQDENIPLTVIPKQFVTQYLKVTAAQNAIRTSDRQYDDWAAFARGRAVTAPIPLWEEDFIMPVAGKITTEFGLTRYVNNANPTRHSGLDIAAPKGTPVKATNSGRVTLAQSLYVPGNTVIIDHGLNILSNYYHLDKIYVKEGDEVKKGDIIGAVGSTGFSTGPHLHWTMTVGTVSVSPWQILEKNPLELLNLSELQ